MLCCKPYPKHAASCRIPFTHVQELEFTDSKSFRIISTLLTTMRPNNLDVPYGTHKGKAVLWQFSLPYAPLDDFMLQAQKQLAMSRLPRAEREDLLQVLTNSFLLGKTSAQNCIAPSADMLPALSPPNIRFYARQPFENLSNLSGCKYGLTTTSASESPATFCKDASCKYLIR